MWIIFIGKVDLFIISGNKVIIGMVGILEYGRWLIVDFRIERDN